MRHEYIFAAGYVILMCSRKCAACDLVIRKYKK